MSESPIKIKRALISVSDKSGLVPFARSLEELGIELVSTGGTSAKLQEEGIAVKDVSDLTQFPEMMDGRLKTLHPVVHGGLLAVRGNASHQESQATHGIGDIDLLVVNLYPFEATVSRGGGLPECIENIDIGGPAMIRAAAKNHDAVTVVVDVADYDQILNEIRENNGGTLLKTRQLLAAKAYARTAEYDGHISNYLGSSFAGLEADAFSLSPVLSLQYHKLQPMRYGENAHQKAAFYMESGSAEVSVATATQLQGKELSYNNIADTDAALECVKQFGDEPACVIVKHANPCGVALGTSLMEAYDRAYTTDPESAFGGIIAFNGVLDGDIAAEIVKRQFVEVIIAPEVSPEASQAVAKKKNVRLLSCGQWEKEAKDRLDFKKVTGGLLVQQADLALHKELEVVTERQPSETEMRDLLFAWKVCKFVKSNAIVYCGDQMTYGVGAGQMSRVNSARIAAIKAEHAGLDLKGSVVASDAFFPFADGLMVAVDAGATAVIQPGGSMRDKEVIAAADEAGLAMVMTGMRHFRH